MGWDSEMPLLLRNMINDVNEDESKRTYSDERLQQLILLSAQLVVMDIGGFDTVYDINIEDNVIDPDPTDRDAQTRNESFVNLALIKAACIIDNSEARLASNKGIAIRDGSSSIDLRGNVSAKLAIWKEGWCKQYDRARQDYFINRNDGAGAAIIGPFRLAGGAPYGWGYGTDLFEDGRYR